MLADGMVGAVWYLATTKGSSHLLVLFWLSDVDCECLFIGCAPRCGTFVDRWKPRSLALRRMDGQTLRAI